MQQKSVDSRPVDGLHEKSGARHARGLGLNEAAVLDALRQLLASLGIAASVTSLSPTSAPEIPKSITISAVADRYMEFAKTYYYPSSGSSAHESANIDLALRPLRALYGNTPAAEFGPMRLKRARDRMIEAGWCRTQINKQVGRVKRMLKWAVENELIPASVHQSVQTVGRRASVHRAGASGTRRLPLVRRALSYG